MDFTGEASLRILGVLFAVLLAVLAYVVLRLRKVDRRRRGLENALQLQRRGLQLRDAMLRHSIGFHLALDTAGNILIHAGDRDLISRMEPQTVDLNWILSSLSEDAEKHVRQGLAQASENPRTLTLSNADGRALTCRIERARVQDNDFVFLTFQAGGKAT